MSIRSAATVLVAALLSSCSLLPGGDDPEPVVTDSGPLPAVAWQPGEGAEVARGGTLRLAVGALPPNFNPQHAANAATEIDRILDPATGSAVRITADGGWEVDPTYARSVEVVDRSPLTVEVVLNPDAAWDQGGPVVADDMVATWKALDGSNDAYQVRTSDGYDDIASVEPGDDEFSYTVTFDDPTVDWPRYVYPSMPAEVAADPDQFNDAFTDGPIASNGPFRITRVDRDRGRVVLERNPHWWGRTPRLETITFQAATPAVQFEAIDGGELDAVVVPPATRGDLGDLSDDVEVQVAAGTEWTHLTMNAGRAPLDDVDVRRAVATALDRTALARLATAPVGAPTVTLGSFVFVPGQRGYTDQSDLLEHDAAAAGRMLDEAGWEPGGDGVREKDGTRLELVMPVPRGTAQSVERADLVAEQLEAVGVEVTREPVDDADFFADRIIPLDFDLATFTHTGSAFPVVEARDRVYPIDSVQNFTGTEDDELGRAWDEAIEAPDDDELVRDVRTIDERLFRDVPIVPLGVVPEVMVVGRDVLNLGAAQFEHPVWTSVGFAPPDD